MWRALYVPRWIIATPKNREFSPQPPIKHGKIRTLTAKYLDFFVFFGHGLNLNFIENIFEHAKRAYDRRGSAIVTGDIVAEDTRKDRRRMT
jgi:hypothetical protein